MKKQLIISAVVASAFFAAGGYGWGSLVSSFPAPGGSSYPNGVAYYANVLYIGTNSPDRIWQTDTSGSVIRSFSSPTTTTMGVTAGIDSSTVFYAVVSYTPRYVYGAESTTGSIVGSYSVPGNYPNGAAYRAPGYLYYTDSGPARRLYLMELTSGSIYSSYSLSFDPNDLAYDASGFLWIVDSSGLVRKCTLTGSSIDSFSVSAYGYPSGCGYDGTYVWVGINAPLHSILQFEVAGSPVAPASLGRIKSLFR